MSFARWTSHKKALSCVRRLLSRSQDRESAFVFNLGEAIRSMDKFSLWGTFESYHRSMELLQHQLGLGHEKMDEMRRKSCPAACRSPSRRAK